MRSNWMPIAVLVAFAGAAGLTACTTKYKFYLPEGDPVAGKEAVRTMQCYVCHEFAGSDLPAPHAQPEVPVDIGVAQAAQSRGQLIESIIAPSHKVPEDLEGATSGELSRMGDYSHAMSVRQLVDIVAYIQSLPEEG